MAITILAVLAGWGFQQRPSRVSAAAGAVRNQVMQARFRAISTAEPVAVVYRPLERAFETVDIGRSSLAAGCEQGEVVHTVELDEFPRVRAVSVPDKGIVWLPNGTGRTCGGSGAFNQTITLEDDRREARIIVSRAGRVRSEVDL